MMQILPSLLLFGIVSPVTPCDYGFINVKFVYTSIAVLEVMSRGMIIAPILLHETS